MINPELISAEKSQHNVKKHILAVRDSLEEKHREIVDSMSLEEMTRFSKTECHRVLQAEMRERVSETVPDLVIESKTFFLSNAVYHGVQAVRRRLEADIIKQAETDRGSRRNKLVDIVFTPVNAIRRRLRLSLSPLQGEASVDLTRSNSSESLMDLVTAPTLTQDTEEGTASQDGSANDIDPPSPSQSGNAHGESQSTLEDILEVDETLPNSQDIIDSSQTAVGPQNVKLPQNVRMTQNVIICRKS